MELPWCLGEGLPLMKLGVIQVREINQLEEMDRPEFTVAKILLRGSREGVLENLVYPVSSHANPMIEGTDNATPDYQDWSHGKICVALFGPFGRSLDVKTRSFTKQRSGLRLGSFRQGGLFEEWRLGYLGRI
jgi:hypothetical protein